DAGEVVGAGRVAVGVGLAEVIDAIVTTGAREFARLAVLVAAAVLARGARGAERVVVEPPVAVVVDAVADLGGRRVAARAHHRARPAQGGAGGARQRQLVAAAAGDAEARVALVHRRRLVHLAVAVVVEAVADLGVGRAGDAHRLLLLVIAGQLAGAAAARGR